MNRREDPVYAERLAKAWEMIKGYEEEVGAIPPRRAPLPIDTYCERGRLLAAHVENDVDVLVAVRTNRGHQMLNVTSIDYVTGDWIAFFGYVAARAAGETGEERSRRLARLLAYGMPVPSPPFTAADASLARSFAGAAVAEREEFIAWPDDAVFPLTRPGHDDVLAKLAELEESFQ